MLAGTLAAPWLGNEMGMRRWNLSIID